MRSKRDNLKLMDDLARMAGSALPALGGLRQQVKGLVNAFLGEMDLVTRDEFERVEALAQKARERQVELEKRLAALEKKTPQKTPKGKKKK